MLMDYVSQYYMLNEKEKGRALSEKLIELKQEILMYYSRFNDRFFPSYYDELENNLLVYGEIVRIISKYEEKSYSDKIQNEYIEHLELFRHLIDE